MDRIWYLVFSYFGGEGLYKDKEDKKIEIVGVEQEEDAYLKAVVMWEEIIKSEEYDFKKGTIVRKPFKPRLIFERNIF